MGGSGGEGGGGAEVSCMPEYFLQRLALSENQVVLPTNITYLFVRKLPLEKFGGGGGAAAQPPPLLARILMLSHAIWALFWSILIYTKRN